MGGIANWDTIQIVSFVRRVWPYADEAVTLWLPHELLLACLQPIHCKPAISMLGVYSHFIVSGPIADC